MAEERLEVAQHLRAAVAVLHDPVDEVGAGQVEVGGRDALRLVGQQRIGFVAEQGVDVGAHLALLRGRGASVADTLRRSGRLTGAHGRQGRGSADPARTPGVPVTASPYGGDTSPHPPVRSFRAGPPAARATEPSQGVRHP